MRMVKDYRNGIYPILSGCQVRISFREIKIKGGKNANHN